MDLDIIHYHAGSRGDFVAGWLGCLPDYVDNNWTIDPATGKSMSDATYFKLFPKQPVQTLQEFVREWGFDLASRTNNRIVAATHHDHIADLIPSELRAITRLITITVKNVDLDWLAWEHYVKQYLCSYPMPDGTVHIIDRLLPPHLRHDDARLGLALDIFHKGRPKGVREHAGCANADVILDYAEILVKGGSRILCELLTLPAEQQHHELWDLSIDAAKSPDEISVWGHVFRFSDFCAVVK
jgi:hypothetical protein